MKLPGIRQQMLLLTLLPLMLLVTLGAAVFVHWHFSNLDQELENRAKLIAHQLASSSEFGVFSGDIVYLQQIAQSTLEQPDVRGLVVLDKNDRVMLAAGGFGRISTGGAVRAREKFDEVDAGNPIKRNVHSLWLYKQITAAQISLGEFEIEKPAITQLGAVVIEMRLDGVRRSKQQILQGMFVFAAVFGLLVIWLVQLAGRKIALPICRLSDAVEEIGKGQLGTRLVLDTRVLELERLAAGLNEMSAQLQRDRENLELRVRQATEALQAKLVETEQLARTDALTGIRNRRDVLEAGERELRLAVRSGSPLSVVVFDVDLFKQVNDTYGHAEGDRVLRGIAACVSGMIRATDLLGRTGGEEFILFLPNTTSGEAVYLADRIRLEVERSVTVGERQHATISMGVATACNGTESRLDDLLAMADRALYRAKANGRNRVEADGDGLSVAPSDATGGRYDEPR